MLMKRIACLLLTAVLLMSAAAAETFADVALSAQAAQEDIRLAMSAPATGYQSRLAAMEKMIVYMSEGRVGSGSQLWPIAEAFGFQYDASKARVDNANSLYAFLSARLAWYAADDYASISSFMADMASVVGQSYGLKALGMTWTFSNGVWSARFDWADLEEIVRLLGSYSQFVGLTVEEFCDLYTQIGQFYDVGE